MSVKRYTNVTIRALRKMLLPYQVRSPVKSKHTFGSKRQARSRAHGRSIGVPPVFPIRVRDDDQKLAGRISPRSHSPICSRHSETQARRLCYYRLGVMPHLSPVGESSLLEMSKLQGKAGRFAYSRR